MQVNLLFGFLGSGKTTLVKHLLAERGREVKTAVIVNEFGDVGVDGDILRGNNVDMVELNSGCLCCTLRGSLMLAVEELRSKAKVDRIIIEATGVAQPGELLDTLADSSLKLDFEVGPLVTVIDVAKFKKLHSMLGEFYEAQIENADVLILNKIDLATPEQQAEVLGDVREINPAAEIVFAQQCEVDTDALLNGRSSQLPDDRATAFTPAARSGVAERTQHEHGDTAHGHLHDAPVETFALDASLETARDDVRRFFSQLNDSVWRAKGFMRMNGASFLVQYSAGQLDITPSPRRTRHEVVFIGHDMDRSGIASAFAALPETEPSPGSH